MHTGYPRWTLRDSVFAPRTMETISFNLLNTADIYDDCAKIDFQSFRISNDIEDTVERKNVLDCIQSYYMELIDIFTYQAIQSKTPSIFVLDLSSYISWLKSLGVLDNQYSEENIRQLWNKAKELGEVHALTHFNGKQNSNGFGQEIFGCIKAFYSFVSPYCYRSLSY